MDPVDPVALARLLIDIDSTTGHEGAVAAAGQAFDRPHLDRMLSGLGNRVFLMNNVHDDGPTLFQTRWVMSYLRGPLSREQVQRLTAAGPAAPVDAGATPQKLTTTPAKPGNVAVARPVLPSGVSEFFLATSAAETTYVPRVFAAGRVRYVNAKLGVNELRSVALTAELEDEGVVLWATSSLFDSEQQTLQKQPISSAKFAALPVAAQRPAALKSWQKEFADHLVHERPLDLYRCASLKTTSTIGESESAFRARMTMAARQWRDELLSTLHGKYADKFARAQDRLRRAEDRVSREETEMQQSSYDTAFSVGASVLGALMGKRVSSGRAVRSVNKGARQRQDVDAAAGELQAAREALAALNNELSEKMRTVEAQTDVTRLELEHVQVRPKKSDVSVGVMGILWLPETGGA